jgi:hypothetical protein
MEAIVDSRAPSLLETLERQLPNGFHDAALYELHIDYSNRQLTLTLGADVSPAMARVPIYRKCSLRVSDLLFVVIESADIMETLTRGNEASVDAASLEGKELDRVWPTGLPEGSFAYWFYVHGVRSSIYFGARGAALEWLE